MAATAAIFSIEGVCARRTDQWSSDKTKIAAAASAAKLDFILTLGNAVHKLKQLNVPKKERTKEDWQGELEKACCASMLMWSVKSKAIKSVISEKDTSFTDMKPAEQTKCKAFVFDEFLKSANQAFVNALTKFLLPDGDKQKGPMVEALRAVIMTPSLTKLRQGDFSDWTTSWNYTELAADQPAVHLWVQILDIFEGAGQSGVNSFYGQLTAAVTSCNPNKGGTYTEVDSQLRHVLTQLVTASGGDAQKMADTLQAEMRLEAMRRLRRNPAEGKAWSDAIAIVVRAQASNRGVLTMAQTDEAARAARSLIEQGQGADPTLGNSKMKTKHDEILRVLKSMIKGKKPADSTSPRQDCSICGKKHAGGAAACWQRPGGKHDPAKKNDSAPQPSKRKALRAELRALAELLQEEASEGESSGNGSVYSSDESDVEGSNKEDDEYFVFMSTQAVSQGLHPDTQAEITIVNNTDFITRHHGRHVELGGVVAGQSLKAEVVSVTIPLVTTTGTPYLLEVPSKSLYHPEAAANLVAHHDLTKAGLSVDYDNGQLLTPAGRIKMVKKRNVWIIPVPQQHGMTTPAVQHDMQILAAGTAGPDDAEKMHQVLFHHGVTSTLGYYDKVHGKGFGKATKATIRKTICACSACTLARGTATYRRTNPPTPQAHSPALRWRNYDDIHVVDDLGPAQDPIMASIRAQLRDNKVNRRSIASVLAEYKPTLWPDAVANALAAIDGVSRRERLQQLRDTEMGELEDKDLGELTPMGELESPEGVDSPTEPAAILTVEKGEQTNFAGNVHEQVPTPILRPGPPLGPQQRERKTGQASPAAIRNDPAPRELWLIDWAVMGQQTRGRGGEQYALIVMDAGSDMIRVIPTKTKTKVWEHLEDLVTLWGYAPKAIRADDAGEFTKDKLFEAWRRKHNVAMCPTQAYRHRMQGKIENAVRNVKEHHRAALISSNIPARFWPDTVEMYEGIHNNMPRQVPRHSQWHQLSPYEIYQPKNLVYDHNLLLHVPACYVIGALAKEHPKVVDTSNGARGFEGMFFGCYRTTPMVKVWVPKLQRMVAMRDVRIYDDRKPFVTACLHDHTGMTKSELAALHNPVRPQPARVTTRTTPVAPIAVDVGTQTQQVAPPADVPTSCHDLITEAKDAALAHFVAERRLVLTLPERAFYDETWTVTCIGTVKNKGRQFIVAEINSGPDANLTRRWKNKTLELPVSRVATEDRDVSLRRAIHLNFPTLHTLQDLVPMCTKSIPFPQRRGETADAEKAALDKGVWANKMKVAEDACIETMEDKTLAKLLVHHRKPLERDQDILEPFNYKTNKAKVTVEFRYLKPLDKAERGMIESISMSDKNVENVRDIINVMHDFPKTIKEIGIHSHTATRMAEAHLSMWEELAHACDTWKRARTATWSADRGHTGVVDAELLEAAPENPFDDERLRKRWAFLTSQTAEDVEEATDLAWIDISEPDPRNQSEARRNPRLWPMWQEEEKIELEGLTKRGCLKKVSRSSLPSGTRVIGSRFHYKIKRHSAGSQKLKVKRLKVRLVVQGQHMSKEKGDYVNAFSPVPHASGVRTIMSIATEQDWDAVACDLTQGFIQADLPKGEKTIYISPPPGVEEDSDVVYEVRRPLYGMPHSGRCLHITWSNWLKEQGFYKVGYEGAMFAKDDGEDKILLSTHVDDSFITGSSTEKLKLFVDAINERFDATFEWNPSEYIGMEWERDRANRTSKLHQAAFSEKMLKAYGAWQHPKPPLTPMRPDTRLSSEDQPEVADPKLHRRYRAIVGAIGWLNSGTRPDLSYCYAELSKFAARPGRVHMDAAEYCLAYISGTYEKGIVYRAGKPGEGNILSGWVDADFAADLDTRRSHTGYLLMLNGGPVSWKSTKQKSVSLSTAESEWYAASEAGKEIIYLRRILDDFGFEQKGPTTLYEDSRAVICMAENPVNRKSSRHIDTRRHFIGELVAAGTVKLADCRTDEMVADALTKSLPYPSFKKHRATMMGEEVKQTKVYQIVMQVG